MTQYTFKIFKVNDNDDIFKHIDHFYSNINKSYFLSRGWVDVWIKHLPDECCVYYVVVLEHNVPLISFFLGKNIRCRYKIYKVGQYVLNYSGSSEYDALCLEYNSFNNNSIDSVIDYNELLSFLPLTWEEFVLTAYDYADLNKTNINSLSKPFLYIEERKIRSHYVDLELVRNADGGYLSLLSSNTRAKIRKSMRIYEKSGVVKLEIPESLDMAYSIFDDLMDLHQKRWISLGKKGAFSSKLFRQFHESLISSRFKSGEIQLLRITNDERTIGCLYNFIWCGRVFFYQCGFDYNYAPKAKPGLVSHSLAVAHNANIGLSEYDFLAGETLYKKSLSTNSREIVWGKIQRRSWKLAVERYIRCLYKKMRS